MGNRNPVRIALRATIAACLLAAMACLAGCLAGRADPEAELARDPAWRAERIEELRAAIDRDHAMLQELISEVRTEDETPVYADSEVRAIAARLTEQMRSLERLEAVQEEERAKR